jgi:Fungal specific transcription factor domain
MASHALAGSYKQNTTDALPYIGRSHYLTHDLPIDETSALAYCASKDKEPSETEAKTLEIWGCSLLPPKAVRQSLVESFMQRCYPWSPVLSPEDIETERPGKQPSLLLNQALFVAASRVLSAPGVAAFASSEQFYQRAKALFWLGHEKNPLTVIAATTMLQWYNPDGPEHVSFDTSRFWLQIGVGLAHQMGLHKEPKLGADCLMRRKLWWSLVVSASWPAFGAVTR